MFFISRISFNRIPNLHSFGAIILNYLLISIIQILTSVLETCTIVMAMQHVTTQWDLTIVLATVDMKEVALTAQVCAYSLVHINPHTGLISTWAVLNFQLCYTATLQCVISRKMCF